MKGILAYCEDPIVSIDIIGDTPLLDLRQRADVGQRLASSRS